MARPGRRGRLGVGLGSGIGDRREIREVGDVLVDGRRVVVGADAVRDADFVELSRVRDGLVPAVVVV